MEQDEFIASHGEKGMSSLIHAARFVHHDGMTVYADRLTPTPVTEKTPVVMIHGGGHSGAWYSSDRISAAAN